jgi:hypothetical protein
MSKIPVVDIKAEAKKQLVGKAKIMQYGGDPLKPVSK